MCFRVAAYKELELLINLQLEVFYCQLRMLEYFMQSLDLYLLAELAQGFVRGCHQSQGAGDSVGSDGYLSWILAWRGKEWVPHDSLRVGMARQGQHVVPLAPCHSQALLWGIKTYKFYSPIASPHLFCGRLFSGKESLKRANLNLIFHH